ncbi:MAG: DNA methyltransferase [Patescibacteria group bacterium]
MLTLTKKQKLFLDYITKFIEKNGYAPSFEEIKKHFKLSAKSTVHQHISTLTEKGFLNKEHYKARAISVVQDAPLSPTPPYTPTYSYGYKEQPIQHEKIDNFLNKIICGDAVEIMEKMPDYSIDLTVTSPPYDELRNYNGYHFNFEGMAKNLFRVTKNGGMLVWVVGDKIKNGNKSLTSFKQALFFQEIGFNVHDVMIYKKKNTPFMRTNAYTNCFEFMFVLSKGRPKIFNPLKVKTMRQGQEMLPFNKGADGINKKILGELKSEKTKTNIWEYAVGLHGTTSDKIAFEHPAIFPEKLAEDHIISWTKEGDIVFDPMCGSGTTCKMAIKNNRAYIGCDISKEYVDLTNHRLKAQGLRLF